MNTNIQINPGKVIYPELSYTIIGILFEVWNEIGYNHREKYIQNAISAALTNNKIYFQRELKHEIRFKNEKIGYYFFDFLIDNKIVLEIKQREYFSKQDINQVASYLKTSKLKLGLIACFSSKGIKFKRILNIY